MSTHLALTSGPDRIGAHRLTRSDILAAVASVLVGALGAVFYYSDTFRPLAHTYAIWVLLVVLISARQPPLRGALRGGGGLLISVIAFFYGKQLVYDILYPGPGRPYRVSLDELALWGLLGLVGGTALGWMASSIGRSGWLPAAVSAIAIALPAVEAYQRSTEYSDAKPVYFVALLGAVAVLSIGDRQGRQLLRTLYMMIPAVLLAAAVLAGPDVVRSLI